MKHYRYTPSGVCSRLIEFNMAEDGTVSNVTFTGGCSGNTQGVAALSEGGKAEELIHRLAGIRCGAKATSCPDQFSKALVLALKDMRGEGNA